MKITEAFQLLHIGDEINVVAPNRTITLSYDDLQNEYIIHDYYLEKNAKILYFSLEAFKPILKKILYKQINAK